MPGKRIYSLSEINAELPFENLQWKYGVFQSNSSGTGRNKQHSYWIGVHTELGEIEENLWRQLAESVIQKAGEQDLLNALVEWETNRNYTRGSALEIKTKALQLHLSRIFDNPCWVSYIPFNRKYRPEVLENAHIVTVVNECCGKPGEVTQEQIDRGFEGTVACPHCGRWSAFTLYHPEPAVKQNEMEFTL